MIPYETLKEWLEKCQAGLQEVIAAQDVAVKSVRDLERQRATVEGQIYILEQLIDIECTTSDFPTMRKKEKRFIKPVKKRPTKERRWTQRSK